LFEATFGLSSFLRKEEEDFFFWPPKQQGEKRKKRGGREELSKLGYGKIFLMIQKNSIGKTFFHPFTHQSQ